MRYAKPEPYRRRERQPHVHLCDECAHIPYPPGSPEFEIELCGKCIDEIAEDDELDAHCEEGAIDEWL